MSENVGFAVIYRWRIRDGQELAFRQAWERGTECLMRRCGALGSRLHRCEDGSWMAYAQWPSREAWERATPLEALDSDCWDRLSKSVAERDAPILLTPVADYLVAANIAAGSFG